MRWFTSAVLAALVVSGMALGTRAEDQDPKAIIDHGIKALGGADRLEKVKAYTWKSKTKLFFGDNENAMTTHSTVQGLDHYRSEFEGKFGDNEVKGVVVVNGDKGWRKFGDDPMELDAEALANEKRMVYLSLVPTILMPLKGDSFKVEAAGEEKVGDKPAVALKITAPDKKDFKLFFDKESGLPVKLVAKVLGFDGSEFTMETSYAEYKEFDGIKKATKVESKRDGDKFFDQEVTEFKLLPEAPAGTFNEPK
jgi:hypothetical protein